MHFVFWQNIISPHQAPFLRALPDLKHRVTVITQEAMSEERVNLGWKVPEMGAVKLIFSPKIECIQPIISDAGEEAIHIMAGARLSSLGREATRICIKRHSRLGILTEAPDPRGVGRFGRRLKYIFERYTSGQAFDFLLAMGEIGIRWFRGCGYSSEKCFPFAYVTEPRGNLVKERKNGLITLLYVGQYIDRKGLDILLRALSGFACDQWQLQFLGDGPEKTSLDILGKVLKISDRIIWLPKSDALGVWNAMSNADITLLPSRHDGWGAVVNESLMAGTPVICSAACGAADLIREPWLGTVFESESVSALQIALKKWIKLGSRTTAERERIRSWTPCISGESVARYFLKIMGHVYANEPRPTAPWRLMLENCQ